jgi:hypothetical protein
MADNEKTTHEKYSHDSERTATAVEDARPRKKSFVDVDQDKLSAAFENPLSGIPKAQLLEEVETFCRDNDLSDHIDAFRRGALVAQNPDDPDNISELTPEDREALAKEHTHRWSQPFTLYWLVVMCSMAAAVQGMDETVNNGAQALYLKELNITKARFSEGMVDNITGLVVGAPYRKSYVPLSGNRLIASTSMLCDPWLLVDRALEQGVRSSRNHLPLLCYCSGSLDLGRPRK